MIKTLFAYIIMCIVPLASAAQEMPFRMLEPVELPLSIEMTRVYFDHKGLMWIGTESGLIRYDGRTMLTHRSDQEHPDLLPNNSVMSMIDDRKGSFWVGTRNGILRIERVSGRCRTYHIKGNNSQIIYALYATHDGQVWAGTNNGASFYDAEIDAFVHVGAENSLLTVGQENHSRPRRPMKEGYSVKSFVESKNGRFLYIGTWANGLLRLDQTTFSSYKSNKNHKILFDQLPLINGNKKAISLCMDSKGRLWVGTWANGLCCIQRPYDFSNPMPVCFNNNRNDFNCIYNVLEDSNNHLLWACSNEGIVTIDLDDFSSATQNYPMPYLSWMEKDAIGNIWIQSKYGSIKQVSTVASPFRLISLADPQVPKGNNSVHSIFTANGNVFYASMMPFGLARYEFSTGKTLYDTNIPTFSNFHPGLFKSPIKAIIGRQNGEIWMGSEFYGIFCFREQGKAYEINKQNSDWLHDNCVNAFYELDNGQMLVGTGRGLFMEKHHFTKGCMPLLTQDGDLSVSDIRCITKDHKGHFWLATENNGIIFVDFANRINQPLCRQYAPSNNKLAVTGATAVMEDSRHRLWAISNSGGLFLYDSVLDCFESVNARFHLQTNNVYAIKEDSAGCIWFTTEQGLAKMSFGEKGEAHVRYYTAEDGLVSMLFLPNSAFSYGDKMYFGTSGGFACFSPSTLKDISPVKKENILISDILLDDKSIASLPDDEREKVSLYAPEFSKHITIPASADKFSIVFALLSYVSPSNNKYAYRLEGYQQEWYYLPHGEHSATFMNLRPGRYNLYIKAAGNNGVWQQLSYPIEITILPPWYTSWWALLLYFVIAGVAIWGIFLLYKRHINTRNQLQMTSLFTNIAHELLTPLTVISMAVENLKSKVPEMEEYESVQGNIMRLSRLLRQILEVRKAQTGNLVLKVEYGNVSDFISRTLEVLRPLKDAKHITLEQSIAPYINGWYDEDKLDKIIYNLLSNATKYTPEGGSIKVTADNIKETLQLTVADNGIGMSEEQQKHLFQKFYDGEYRQMGTNGTGLGLSLVNELVTLHHGTITCSSTVGKGTTFTVDIPLYASAYSSVERIAEAASTPARRVVETPHISETTTPGSHTILFVEDNAELLSLMESTLSSHYNILAATNGEMALRVISKKDVDCVVSDVMMPIMDGITLTRKIKENPDTQQLPVILLTARTSDEHRNEGYRSGADDYITKPFKVKELQLRIDIIIANRERIRQRFSRQTDYHIENEHYSSPDQLFLEKAFECVRTHLGDMEYSREQFALDMCVSSSTLYNKLRALTGQNVSAFISSVRLKEACRILKNNPSIPINELSVRVGFNTAHYFSRCFKKEFGMNPTEYIHGLQ